MRYALTIILALCLQSCAKSEHWMLDIDTSDWQEYQFSDSQKAQLDDLITSEMESDSLIANTIDEWSRDPDGRIDSQWPWQRWRVMFYKHFEE